MSDYGLKMVHRESVSAVTATPSEKLGSRRFYGGIEYLYMYNAGDEAYKGCPVIISGSTSGYSFVTTYATVAVVTDSAGDMPGGFVGTVHNATCAASSYCWVAMRGAINCRPCSVAISAGDAIKVMDGGNAVESREGFTDTTTTSAQQIASYICNYHIGQAMEAATAAATGVIKVWVR